MNVPASTSNYTGTDCQPALKLIHVRLRHQYEGNNRDQTDEKWVSDSIMEVWDDNLPQKPTHIDR